MKRTFIIAALIGLLIVPATAQRKKPVPKPAPAIFAILNDGKSLEPIAKIERGTLLPLSDGGDDAPTIKKFVGAYYKLNTKYKLVFGAADAGIVTVRSSSPEAECSRNFAEVTVASTRAKLKGMVMGLATNAIVKGSGVRRLPTAAERAEAETLVRAEFAKNEIPAAVAKNLRYHNLTALDLDSDGKAELVGSFWVEKAAKERALLFFIAEKNAEGKYEFGYSEFRAIKESEVMSEDITALDSGVYNELLLDAFDYNADGFAEVFTYIQSFEGAGFSAYAKKNGKWERVFEGSNYHCGY
ncbi:MAG: hypothetical protein IPN69_11330 [Acidobacteria bacterium]|nr:hypothetical protein [Acidobacteriota bacterium]MBK8811307.1 hypothetical protein [Acidobacteriota bacterium]